MKLIDLLFVSGRAILPISIDACYYSYFYIFLAKLLKASGSSAISFFFKLIFFHFLFYFPPFFNFFLNSSSLLLTVINLSSKIRCWEIRLPVRAFWHGAYGTPSLVLYAMNIQSGRKTTPRFENIAHLSWETRNCPL